VAEAKAGINYNEKSV